MVNPSSMRPITASLFSKTPSDNPSGTPSKEPATAPAPSEENVTGKPLSELPVSRDPSTSAPSKSDATLRPSVSSVV